jgi:hypothetical protein
VAQIWAKFNKNERNVSFGAAIVVVAWVIGLVGTYGYGIGILSALGAVAVLVIYYLKYAPNQNISWPAPIPTIVLAISGIIAIVAVLSLIQILGILSLGGLGGLYVIALLGVTAGAVLMAFGAWQEYQAMTASSTSATTPPAQAQTSPAAPAPEPPAASDDQPPS